MNVYCLGDVIGIITTEAVELNIGTYYIIHVVPGLRDFAPLSTASKWYMYCFIRYTIYILSFKKNNTIK